MTGAPNRYPTELRTWPYESARWTVKAFPPRGWTQGPLPQSEAHKTALLHEGHMSTRPGVNP